MTIDELLNSISGLSHADKFRLARFVLDQLAREEGVSPMSPQSPDASFDPRRYHGAAHASREAVDAWLLESREGWNG